jgi:subtilisin family serine protease
MSAADPQLPAWSLGRDEAAPPALPMSWPHEITRDWAWGGSAGAGVRVCIVDSGVDGDHPLVGGLACAVRVVLDDAGEVAIEDDDEPDACGHGTACAGIVRALAPECEITSARVLGPGFKGGGSVLLGGLKWAIEQGHHVVNLSLSTTKAAFVGALHELADRAYFGRTVLVASAHNMPVKSYPWRFSSVVSVASHMGTDPFEFFYNPAPPVEFFARGVDVQMAWAGGSTVRATGNSFATPHVAGLCALVLGKHPDLTPFQLKSILQLTATNARGPV